MSDSTTSPASSDGAAPATPFSDLADFVALPRVAGLALSPRLTQPAAGPTPAGHTAHQEQP